MKRTLAMLLVLVLLLSACGKKNDEASAPSTSEPTASTEPTQPPEEGPLPNLGIYQPDSEIEKETAGAVKKFRLEGKSHYAVITMGEGLLVFSGDEETTLTLYSETADPVRVTLTGCSIYPDGSFTQVTDQGIGYYDEAKKEIVILDGKLQEKQRVRVPEDMKNGPVLSPDLKTAYYLNDTSLRSFELSTGISRLLQEGDFANQEIQAIHFDGTVVECLIDDEQGLRSSFISTENGQTLDTRDSVLSLRTLQQCYFAQWSENGAQQMVFGTRGEKPKSLVRLNQAYMDQPLLQLGALVEATAGDTGTVFSFYDLTLGTKSASVQWTKLGIPWGVVGDAQRKLVWFLAEEEGNATNLYCWDPALSQTEDTTSYVTPFYTAESPDKKGLEECAQRAKELGNKYNLRIVIWKDTLQYMPSDYTFEAEYMVPVFQLYLDRLEQALARYPKNFFKTLGKQSNNGKLTISLIRAAYGDNSLGSLTTADGAHYWRSGSGYIFLVMNSRFEQSLYHEMFHAIDSYVLTETKAYDFWDSLNPKGFKYDYDYITNQFRQDYKYLEDGSRSFIDMYSMSFPKEDRARIMEYAMMPGNEAYFKSSTMQSKLKTVCKGIREAFGLKKYAEPLPWEQYLKKPLV